MIDLASIPAYLSKFCYELLRKIGIYRGLQHICEIRAYDKRGRLRAFRFVRQKLILDNWKQILAKSLLPEYTNPGAVDPTADEQASVVDTGGVSRGLWVIANTHIGTNQALSYITGYNVVDFVIGTRIRVGTGTVTPTRADYALASEVASGVPTQTIGADYIVWAVAITLTTAQTITEAGLSIRCPVTYRVAPPTFQDILLFRDVFPTPVDVPAGGTISVTEKLAL